MAKKNANGDGSRPRKRADGRWEARYWSEGRRRSVYGGSRKEAAARLARAMTGVDEAEKAFVPSDITVDGFLAQYGVVARGAMKHRSFETYESIVKVHLVPELGTMRLADLRREDVQGMYSRKVASGLSAARVRRIHGTLSAALNRAVEWRLVERNVCREVSPPRVPTPEVRALSLEEARRFLLAAEGDRHHALYVLGVTSGIRFGEMGGLFWSDVDLDGGALMVQRSLVTGYGQTFEPPKTPNSRRSIVLTNGAVEALERHWERQESGGFPVGGENLVFTNTVGRPLNPSHLLCRSFKPLLRRTGLPETTFHAATRHTCCCILLAAGVNPRVVSLQLGHSSVAFTLQRYASYLPGWGNDGAMDRALKTSGA